MFYFLSHTVPGPNDTSCSEVRQEALEMIENGVVDIYVPSCDEDGFYETGFHCYWNFCFCINNKYTGHRIKANSTEDCA